MKQFMDKDFLLSTPTAKTLYHDYSAKNPIIDYHCHLDPKEIAEDKKYETITQLWLGGDHYKWRQMRCHGVDEKYITGNATDFEKFEQYALTLEKAIGNPIYHWTHLELKAYFDFEGSLTGQNAREVFDLCNAKLKDPSMSARGLINQSNVESLCTTDDPIDDLKWHKQIAEDTTFKTKVLPTWRPDKSMAVQAPDYLDYLAKLASASGVTINSYKALTQALSNRMDHFQNVGCSLSDHGLDFIMYAPATPDQIEAIFQKRLKNTPLTEEETLQFKTAAMQFCATEYNKRNWVMQIHFGCKRSINSLMFEKLGPDTGFDCISNYAPSPLAAEFLDSLYSTNSLPRTILYSLNPADDAYIGTLLGCFCDGSARSKVMQGSAWWFNDQKTGMIAQMTSLANLGLLGNFLGMLTDSRSFTSYPRHEYFRRILCELVGDLVENGEYPNDPRLLKSLIDGISYQNAKDYFKF
ncbi:MAG: glucuronate isomerase [Eubacteriales bacterium]